MNIILSGAFGRMGKQIICLAKEYGYRIVAGIDRIQPDENVSFPAFDSFEKLAGIDITADVIIDFSSPTVLPSLLSFALEHGIPVLLAATGYTDEDIARIHLAAEKIPIFKSSNLSIGIQIMKLLVEKASAVLQDFDIEIIEKHHNQKKDAPSGTALMLLDAVRKADSEPVFGRSGPDCKRKIGEIGIHSIRGGSLAGEHEVDFLGSKEMLSVTHSAQDRSIFAHGALRAAAFLIEERPGLYDMSDMIRL